jgi:hypothetical protein
MAYQKSSYQASLVASLVKLHPTQQVSLLEGLYRHGALDLDAVNEKGLNLIEAMLDETNASADLVHFMDRIGRSDLYAQPGNNTWHIMNKQLMRWMTTASVNSNERDASLSLMINQVDPGWWKHFDGEYDDEGSVAASKLTRLESRGVQSLRSLWARGVDLHCRYGKDRALSVSLMRREEMLDCFLEKGGNLDLDTYENKTPSIPLWRHLSQNSPQQLGWSILEMRKSDPLQSTLWNNDQLLREVSSNKKSLSKMTKKLFEAADWPHTKRLDGTPAWLWAMSLRGETLKVFLDRKRNSPTLTERDAQGRGAWFWALTNTTPDPDALDKLNQVLPAHIYAKDSQGRGLITQLLDYAAQPPFIKEVTKWHALLDLLSWDKITDRSILLDGLDGVDLAPLFANAAVSENYSRPKPLYELLINPETRAAMNPTQRGICLCGATIFYKRQGSTGQQPAEWNGMREAIWKDCENLGIEWPEMAPFEAIMKTMQLTSERDLFEIASWKTGLERQSLSQQTTTIHRSRPGARRI